MANRRGVGAFMLGVGVVAGVLLAQLLGVWLTLAIGVLYVGLGLLSAWLVVRQEATHG